MEVLVDQVAQNVAVARSASDAPEIDGTVRISGSAQALKRIAVGSMLRVKISASGPYDLEARLAT